MKKEKRSGNEQKKKNRKRKKNTIVSRIRTCMIPPGRWFRTVQLIIYLVLKNMENVKLFIL